MLNNIQFPKSKSYRTGSEHEPLKFYLDCLSNAKEFDLLLGYFSSAAINVLSLGFAQFIYKGGKMRIVANHILSEEDKAAVIAGKNKDVQIPFDLEDISSIRSGLDEYGKHFFKCLAYLIANDRIEIKIVKPKSKGIAHYKDGIFRDDNDSVSFHASCNFTAFGLLENAESLNCFLASDSEASKHKIVEDQAYFDQIFEGKANHLEYLDIHQITIAIKNEFNGDDLKELLVEESDLIRKKNQIFKSKELEAYVSVLELELEKIANEPRFPYPEEREIQKKAYKAWIENDRKGIFAMATGSGKTITALNCILKEYQKNGFYKVIIAVPTQALAMQWEKEVVAFNFQNVVSTHTQKNWKDILRRYTTRSIFEQKKNIIIITTYATFNRSEIQTFITKTKGVDSFMYIADEAHNIGSPTSLKNIPQQINQRIGLSATPERIYDEGGSEKMYQFFNSKPPQYTFRYTMKQAIDNKILCHYDYYPIFVELTEIEMIEYKNITSNLRKYIDTETGKYKKEAEMLLLKRKRIVHKAENKKTAISTLLDSFKSEHKLKYTFVFVPEGYEPDYADDEEYEIDNEDMHIIDEYAEMFKARKYKYYKFTGGIKDSEQILKNFADGHIDVLLAMKCLDEGVDIPRTEHAVFCSSTGNPRQFVQRRGRVLRKSEGKDKAKIWDLIVLPPNIDGGISTVEKSLFTAEVKRIANFAVLADNQIDILYGELKDYCEILGIDLFEMLEKENEQYN
ncbi:Superfamily II DNA or RNA helicase [Pedobacter suwonensis]|uniref:Superfamily II DNA or RNA helicase n=1 Tax=Pedobacter suwonensis TaxID=332999 RepID=A0A1I0U5U7_9SPHI|nr:DEAD/DEAH box helicase family protein [Pedobacter suwonensis]SFA58586.1 Superfamily II DNA or RNA helicase [Pedobacter suwonensis]